MALHGLRTCVIGTCSWASVMRLRSVCESPRTLPRLLHPSSTMFELSIHGRGCSSRILHGDACTRMGRGPSTSASTRAMGKRDRVLMKASRPNCHTVMLCWNWSRAAVRLVLPPSSAASDGLVTYFLYRASLHGDAQYRMRTSFSADPPDHVVEPLRYP